MYRLPISDFEPKVIDGVSLDMLYEKIREDIRNCRPILFENYKKYTEVIDFEEFDFSLFKDSALAYNRPENEWIKIPESVQVLISQGLLKETDFAAGPLVADKTKNRFFVVANGVSPCHFFVLLRNEKYCMLESLTRNCNINQTRELDKDFVFPLGFLVDLKLEYKPTKTLYSITDRIDSLSLQYHMSGECSEAS